MDTLDDDFSNLFKNETKSLTYDEKWNILKENIPTHICTPLDEHIDLLYAAFSNGFFMYENEYIGLVQVEVYNLCKKLCEEGFEADKVILNTILTNMTSFNFWKIAEYALYSKNTSWIEYFKDNALYLYNNEVEFSDDDIDDIEYDFEFKYDTDFSAPYEEESRMFKGKHFIEKQYYIYVNLIKSVYFFIFRNDDDDTFSYNVKNTYYLFVRKVLSYHHLTEDQQYDIIYLIKNTGTYIGLKSIIDIYKHNHKYIWKYISKKIKFINNVYSHIAKSISIFYVKNKTYINKYNLDIDYQSLKDIFKHFGSYNIDLLTCIAIYNYNDKNLDDFKDAFYLSLYDISQGENDDVDEKDIRDLYNKLQNIFTYFVVYCDNVDDVISIIKMIKNIDNIAENIKSLLNIEDLNKDFLLNLLNRNIMEIINHEDYDVINKRKQSWADTKYFTENRDSIVDTFTKYIELGDAISSYPKLQAYHTFYSMDYTNYYYLVDGMRKEIEIMINFCKTFKDSEVYYKIIFYVCKIVSIFGELMRNEKGLYIETYKFEKVFNERSSDEEKLYFIEKLYYDALESLNKNN